ncbi:MAG: RDD family protein [bacterium]|nr:RDD family protein [bacterium]
MSDTPVHGLDTLETPERVDLEVELAGVGSRSLAYMLDFLLLIVVILGSVLILTQIEAFAGTAAAVLMTLLVFSLYWFYFAVFEAAWNGQTPGKRLMGLRVQKVGGYPIGVAEALIRNFLRPLVDLFGGGLPIGLLVMLFTRRHQRVGDLAAGTVVVREKTAQVGNVESLGFVAADSDAAVSTSGLRLSAEEFELLNDYLTRSHGFDLGSRRRLETRLAEMLRLRLDERGGLPERLLGLTDEAFLINLDALYRGELQ